MFLRNKIKFGHPSLITPMVLKNRFNIWHNCKLCGIPNASLICRHCINEIEFLPATHCPICLIPSTPEHKICSTCNSNTIYYNNLYCKLCYATPLNKMLLELKYHGEKSNAWLLGYLLSLNIEKTKSYDIIIPMPLHKDKLATRGFNQVELLLKYFHNEQKYPPINTKIVIRHKNTQTQALLNSASRELNVANAFKLQHNVKGLKVLLVDDVVTTGATINQLAKLFKDNGATMVDACCLMRAII